MPACILKPCCTGGRTGGKGGRGRISPDRGVAAKCGGSPGRMGAGRLRRGGRTHLPPAAGGLSGVSRPGWAARYVALPGGGRPGSRAANLQALRMYDRSEGAFAFGAVSRAASSSARAEPLGGIGRRRCVASWNMPRADWQHGACSRAGPCQSRIGRNCTDRRALVQAVLMDSLEALFSQRGS